MPVAGGPALTVVDTGSIDNGGQVSPDSRWIAYMSNESGKPAIWVQPFSPTGKPSGKRKVSKDGVLSSARWRKDGREIVFIDADGFVTVVPVKTDGNFSFGPEPLFRLPKEFLAMSDALGPFFDAAPDNQKFLVLLPANRTPIDEFTVVLNWPDAMKKEADK
jgi:hypothetical protein